MRTDLIKHIILSMRISFALAIGIWLVTHNLLMLLAFPLTVLVGAGKELIWDKWLKKGTPEWKDFYSGVWGSLFGTILAYVVCFYFLQ